MTEASQVPRVGPSSYHCRIDLESFGQASFFGRRKKKLDPADFVSIREGFREVDICHSKCASFLLALVSEETGEPVETWTCSSLKLQLGGIPIKHELRCRVCPIGWDLEEKK